MDRGPLWNPVVGSTFKVIELTAGRVLELRTPPRGLDARIDEGALP
jgi:hypothetical protein